MDNHVSLTGIFAEKKAIRFTPAGIPVLEGWFECSASVFENDQKRLVEFGIGVVAIGKTVRWLEAAQLGQVVKITGFLAAKSRHGKALILHLNAIEFLQGNQNGSLLQKEG